MFSIFTSLIAAVRLNTYNYTILYRIDLPTGVQDRSCIHGIEWSKINAEKVSHSILSRGTNGLPYTYQILMSRLRIKAT